MNDAVDRIAIIPPTPEACPYCGDRHDPRDPHNRDSLTYQHKFRKAYGRYPTWEDAMRHCSLMTQIRFAAELKERGITVEVMNGQQRMDQP